ncbi:hypothetical protein ACFFHM_16420 [Halalkalibacter kiskunsagensis]|uniref:Uncharacterized protein n=1 Tax=Halalkalibacter kiskunsagensis TaxID=1548599 RepID=A0ABV6KG50_9BACI
MKDDKSSVREAEMLLKQFREEYAHEFGFHHSVQESDSKTNLMKYILNQKDKDADKENQEEKKKQRK